LNFFLLAITALISRKKSRKQTLSFTNSNEQKDKFSGRKEVSFDLSTDKELHHPTIGNQAIFVISW
jgi:hypothetical protein